MAEKKNKTSKNSKTAITTFSIIIGLVVGGIILAIAGYNPFQAYRVIIAGIFSKPKYVTYVIIYATPLILTGLSVAFAFKTGLFNIGAEGQFIIGALVAALCGAFLTLPPILHIIVTILLATAAAALWGAFAGFMKAQFGVHEVIGTIMLNWIALYFNNFIVGLEGIKRPQSENTYKILSSARIDLFGEWKLSPEGVAWAGDHPFLGDILRASPNLGIIFAFLAALLVAFILKRTTLGYQLRAVGLNKSAAQYGGINVKRSILLSMAIAGGLAGLAGAVQVLGRTRDVAVLNAMEGFGFDGIAVALIGSSSPLGCVLAGFLFGALKYGGSKIQPVLGAPSEIISIIIGTIVLFVAMPRLIKPVLRFFKRILGGKKDA